MKRAASLAVALSALAALLVFAGSAASVPAPGSKPRGGDAAGEVSGAAQFRDMDFGHMITECPQAGIDPRSQPQPLDRREKDRAEAVSRGQGQNIRANNDFTCFPQNETSIALNPRNPQRNIIASANDYRLGWGTTGIYSSSDGGRNWYNTIQPFPSLPSGDNLDGGGDPALVFDREGTAYSVQINFNRTDDTNGLFVVRSTNGGFTWSRPCVPTDVTPSNPNDQRAVCGGTGDVRQPGDGVITFNPDDDTLANGSVPFDDKEYVAAGPRPRGVDPVCFTPAQFTVPGAGSGDFTVVQTNPGGDPVACDPAVVGPDRIYVSWTRFDTAGCAANAPPCSTRIMLSYSDDEARSWAPARPISGSAAFCAFSVEGPPNACDFNQGSVPTVNPTTGVLWVGFENFNTPDENQYLVVRSEDGGETFDGPFFVTPVYDVNYPTSGSSRPDCRLRGQQTGRRVLTNSCFRVVAYGNIVADKRGGAFADDLYVVISDNRNGTRVSTNTDTFLFKSVDGGETWVGPTRVNDDASTTPANRECPRTGTGACPTNVHTGNDQWFPWVDIGEKGEVNVTFYDRRLDTGSTEHEWRWLGSRQRPGNYLVWRFGGQCQVTQADSRQCVAATAREIPQPSEPIDPGPGDDIDRQTGSPYRNIIVSDVGSNWDYCFRAGIFCGDYDNVQVAQGRAFAVWTDARNGRSTLQQNTSGASPEPQFGRNPICEQSDIFIRSYGALNGGNVGGGTNRANDSLFLVTPCPAEMIDPGWAARSGGQSNPAN